MKSFFEAIAYITTEFFFAPLDLLRQLELENWFAANLINWLFLVIGLLAFGYWMKQLQFFQDNNEENKDPKAHSFLD